MTAFRTAAALATAAALTACASMPQGVQDFSRDAAAAAQNAASTVRTGVASAAATVTQAVTPTVTVGDKKYEVTRGISELGTQGYASVKLPYAEYSAAVNCVTKTATIGVESKGNYSAASYQNGQRTTYVNGKRVDVSPSSVESSGICNDKFVNPLALVELVRATVGLNDPREVSRPAGSSRIVFPRLGIGG